MKDRDVIRLSRLTRRWMRHRTPGMHGLCKLLLKALCPKATPGTARCLVVDYEGGLIHVDTSSAIEYTLLFRGCHEPEIARLIRNIVRPGDVCLDVGANVGSHTLLMGRAAGPEGRVIAFEPHPEMFERLLQNVSLNHLEQVQPVQAAVSDSDGTADFFGFEKGAFRKGISSLLPDERASNRMEVRTISGTSIERDFGLTRCDFIKIDVEGYDSVVLEALAPLLERTRPHLIFEYRREHWEKFGRSLDDVLDRLRARDYGFYVVARDVTRPLGAIAPEGCEVLCVPRQRAITGTGGHAAGAVSREASPALP